MLGGENLGRFWGEMGKAYVQETDRLELLNCRRLALLLFHVVLRSIVDFGRSDGPGRCFGTGENDENEVGDEHDDEDYSGREQR